MTKIQSLVPLASASGDTVPPLTQSYFLRTHHDGLGDMMSQATATTNLDPSETQTQFTDECDINKILDRYTRGQNPEQRPVKYGEAIDYSIGLQEALNAATEMAAVHDETVPPELRNLYPTWREWLNATANGSYEHELQNLAEKKNRQVEDAKILAEARKNLENPPKDPPKGDKDKKPE